MQFTPQNNSADAAQRDSVDGQRSRSTSTNASKRSLSNSIRELVTLKGANEKWERMGRTAKSPAYGYGSNPGYVTMGY